MQPTPAFEPNPQIETMIAHLYRLTLAHASRIEMQFKDEWKEELDLSSSAHLVRLARMSPNWVTSTREISAEVLRSQGIQNWEEILRANPNDRRYPSVCRYDLGNLFVKGDLQRRLESLRYPSEICSDLLDGLLGRLFYIQPLEEQIFQLVKLEAAFNAALHRLGRPFTIDLLNHVFEFGDHLADHRHPKTGLGVTEEDATFFIEMLGDSMMNPIVGFSQTVGSWNHVLAKTCSTEFLDRSDAMRTRIKTDVDPLLLLQGAREAYAYRLSRQAH